MQSPSFFYRNLDSEATGDYITVVQVLSPLLQVALLYTGTRETRTNNVAG